MIARPFVKAVGGKTALLPEILPRLPEKIRTYYEPFVGGGAVFFALAGEDRFKRATIGDMNGELIDAYLAISIEFDRLVTALKKHVYAEKAYYAVRAQNPKSLSFVSRAARFIYLNRTCFNGLYRVNKKGQFNVPFGRYTNPTICDEENLRAVRDVLHGKGRRLTGVVHDDFEKLVSNAKKGDAVYFDPPYWPKSETSNFTAYTAGGFGTKDQIRLQQVFRRLDKKGVHVLLSNSDTKFVRELYKGCKIEKVSAPRRINSKADKRGDIGELLISGKNRPCP